MKTISKPLRAWSWQDIISLYIVYGMMINEMLEIRKRINIVEPNIDFDDPTNIFLMRFHTDGMKISRNLEALDREIARRNNLIGVV